MFDGFDFGLLNDPNFKEDSVREELTSPMLKAMGYSASPPNQILRSNTLEHPYVYIGTKKYPVKIIPDYVLTRDGRKYVVVDAKAPNEKIHEGKNVEQAYSYAIHKDVRAPFFALCNGHDFVLFHVSKWPHVLSFSLTEADEAWPLVIRILGTEAEVKKISFKPDFGLHLLRMGLAFHQGKPVHQAFNLLDIYHVARIDEDRYTLGSYFEMDSVSYIASFDFTKSLLGEFAAGLEPKSNNAAVMSSLTRAPFRWQANPESPAWVGVGCKTGTALQHTENESFLPFEVLKFF